MSCLQVLKIIIEFAWLLKLLPTLIFILLFTCLFLTLVSIGHFCNGLDVTNIKCSYFFIIMNNITSNFFGCTRENEGKRVKFLNYEDSFGCAHCKTLAWYICQKKVFITDRWSHDWYRNVPLDIFIQWAQSRYCGSIKTTSVSH